MHHHGAGSMARAWVECPEENHQSQSQWDFLPYPTRQAEWWPPGLKGICSASTPFHWAVTLGGWGPTGKPSPTIGRCSPRTYLFLRLLAVSLHVLLPSSSICLSLPEALSCLSLGIPWASGTPTLTLSLYLAVPTAAVGQYVTDIQNETLRLCIPHRDNVYLVISSVIPSVWSKRCFPGHCKHRHLIYTVWDSIF